MIWQIKKKLIQILWVKHITRLSCYHNLGHFLNLWNISAKSALQKKGTNYWTSKFHFFTYLTTAMSEKQAHI